MNDEEIMQEMPEDNKPDSAPETNSLLADIPIITVTEEQPTTNNLQPTTDMEVHHHPQLEHKPKPWKEYLLEGLMIFLAVTMGFIAENIREHLSDASKEKEYAIALVEDLQSDTARIHYSIKRLMNDINYCDSLITFFDAGKIGPEYDKQMAKFGLLGGLSSDVIFNDRAALQLKSTGSIRLIEKKVADSVLKYWNNQLLLAQTHERFETQRILQRSLGFKTFNWYHHYYEGAKKENINKLNQKYQGIINKALLYEFVNASSPLYNSANTQYIPELQDENRLAINLINLIRKEYRLKHE